MASMEITHRKGSAGGGDAEGGGRGDAEARLAKMGYASELPRNLSMLSVLGL
jgi:hypothetical protein